METLTVGCKAYFDSFACGLIPCVVTAIRPDQYYSGNYRVTVRFTAKRGPYLRGEIYEAGSLQVCPRKSVRLRCGQYRIVGYSVEA